MHSRHKLASSVNLYRFTHFFNFAAGSIFKNCLLGQRPQSPRTSPSDDGYAAKLLTISKENICIKMLCDDGDGCDDETESEPGSICIVTIVTTLTFGKIIIFHCEKICKFQNQEYTKSTATVGIANIKDVVQWRLGLLHQQVVSGYG